MKTLLLALATLLFSYQAIAVFKFYADSSFSYRRDDLYSGIFVKMDGYIPFTSMHDITNIVRAAIATETDNILPQNGIAAPISQTFNEPIRSVTAIRLLGSQPDRATDTAFLLRDNENIYIHLAVTEQETMNTPVTADNNQEENIDRDQMLQPLTNFLLHNLQAIKGFQTYSMLPLVTSRVSVNGDFDRTVACQLFNDGFRKNTKSSLPVWMTLGGVSVENDLKDVKEESGSNTNEAGATAAGSSSVKKLKIGNTELEYQELETVYTHQV